MLSILTDFTGSGKDEKQSAITCGKAQLWNPAATWSLLFIIGQLQTS